LATCPTVVSSGSRPPLPLLDVVVETSAFVTVAAAAAGEMSPTVASVELCCVSSLWPRTQV
jgi:hypothetical protein